MVTLSARLLSVGLVSLSFSIVVVVPQPSSSSFTSISTSSSSNFILLPNTRCHNDIYQIHEINDYTACETICPGMNAPLFTYCNPNQAKDCPTLNGTCWCYSLLELSSCETDTNWISGYLPPSPPPADWAALIASGNMAYTTDPPSLIGEGYFPVVGNGFIGIETGNLLQPFANAWPWRDAGSFKMQGVYNGLNYTTPSHRAQLPNLSNMTIPMENGIQYQTIGMAIDFYHGIVYNRTLIINGSSECSPNTIIEQRMYTHRLYRELFVYEVRAYGADTNSTAWNGCSIRVNWNVGPNNGLNDVTFIATPGSASSPAVFSGTTLLPEETSLPLRKIAMVFDDWVYSSSPLTNLTFTPSSPIVSLRVVLRSDLDVPNVNTVQDVVTAAVTTWLNYTTQTSDQLLASHMTTMEALWSTGGVELTGNASFAATVNASLYDIVSSLRADFNWSTSPGGIATGGYAGHSFWDMETWMYPVLVVLFPELAKAASQYRLDRLTASQTNAALSGYDGAMWSWESASSGLWTAPWRQADFNENHISSDIPLAWRKYYYATGDKKFLQNAWSALNSTCTFWECRLQRTDSTGPAPPGYNSNCSPKNGIGNWTVHSVIPPDESSGIVNDCVYTNAGASETLSWCIEAASILGIPSSSLPPLWTDMAASPYLPLNTTLYSEGPVHMQNAGYSGHTINQADVALLQYPLGLDFGIEQNTRDLDYYSTVTNFAGMFTGDSAYACAYLALGNRTQADNQLQLAFNHIEPHFLVFHETAFDDGHTQHFITGNGGYVQAFVFGYSSMRINRLGVLSFASQQPILPPLGVTAMKLRGVHLLGTLFDFYYDNTNQLCVEIQSANNNPATYTPLELRTLSNGNKIPLAIGTPVCVPLQPVEVAGVGYA